MAFDTTLLPPGGASRVSNGLANLTQVFETFFMAQFDGPALNGQKVSFAILTAIMLAPGDPIHPGFAPHSGYFSLAAYRTVITLA
jgi:hypothetical protein